MCRQAGRQAVAQLNSIDVNQRSDNGPIISSSTRSFDDEDDDHQHGHLVCLVNTSTIIILGHIICMQGLKYMSIHPSAIQSSLARSQIPSLGLMRECTDEQTKQQQLHLKRT